ncbi:MAG: hypothetical protein U0793_31625 [Gemmataceae bacterium]
MGTHVVGSAVWATVAAFCLLTHPALRVGPPDKKEDYWTYHVAVGAFSHDNKRAVVGYGGINLEVFASVWDVAKGKQIAVLGGHKRPLKYCAFLPDNERVITVGEDGTVVCHRLKDGGRAETVYRLDAHVGGLWATDLSRNGKRLVTLGLEKRLEVDPKYQVIVKVWDGEKGKLLKRWEVFEFPGVDLVVSPDGGRMMTASFYYHGARQGWIRVWDTETGKLLREFDGDDGWERPIGFANDGKAVVVGNGPDKLPVVRDLCYFDGDLSKEKKRIKKAIVKTGPGLVRERVAGDGCSALVADSERFVPIVRLTSWFWAPEKESISRTLEINRAGSDRRGLGSVGLGFSPDGSLALVASGGNPGVDRLRVHVFETVSGKVVREWDDETRKR